MDTGSGGGPGSICWRCGFRKGSVTGAVLLALWALVLGVPACCPVATAMEATAVSQATPPPARIWTAAIRWENDTVANNDRFYTNGAAVSLAHTGESWANPVIDRLPWGQGRRTVTYSLSQAMFTPEETERATPNPADRPYAGVLTFDLGLHVDRDNRYHGLKLVFGVVGPWAGAGETQREVHRLINTIIPQGWDSQLHNEPIINLAYEHRRKYRVLGRADGWAVEALPVVGFMLGNLLTQGHAGGQVRLGYKIPDDFGATLLRGMSGLPPPRQPLPDTQSTDSTLGFYLYGAVRGNLVLHDITLDGNTFKDSPSVDKELFVPAAGVGVGVGNRRFLAAFSYVFAGKEFKGQRSAAEFGTLTFSYFF